MPVKLWDDTAASFQKPPAWSRGESSQTLIALHSAIFGLTAEQARKSAEWRLLAANTVDLITSRTSTYVEGDWRKLEAYLRKAYSSIVEETQKQSEAIL